MEVRELEEDEVVNRKLNQKFEITHAQRKRRVKKELKEDSPQPTNWRFIIVCIAVLVALFVLRYYENKYNIDYDTFIHYYEILGLEASPTTDINDVKRAFKALALRWHPDKNPGCDECNNKYLEISNAYEQITAHHVVFWEKQAMEATRPTRVRKKV